MIRYYSLMMILTALCAMAPIAAQAQEATGRALGEITEAPLCARLVNETAETVYGVIRTQYFVEPDGTQARHTSNFRLAAGQTQEFCSTGPFFDGRKLDLALRSLFPVFECQTALGGDIVITGTPVPESEGGGVALKAECLP